MRPFARIRKDDIDITESLGARLLSIEVVDEAEDKSDRVTIDIDASPVEGMSMDVPHIGTVVHIEMGYIGGEAADKGSYLIDGLRDGKPAHTLTITGRSANMPSKFRTPRSQSYHQKTLADIIGEIAERNGYEAAIDDKVGNVVIRHVDQDAESDMAFASRLARQYDAVARPVDGRLVVARRGAGEAASGAALPAVSIRESDCARWDFDYSAREEAGEASGLPSAVPEDRNAPAVEGKGGVRAFWTDIRTGLREKVEVGKEPFHELRFTYHNEAEAQAAASAYRNESARGKATFGCEIGGRPSVQAESTMTISGFPNYIPTVWRIKSVTHRYDSGYVTTIQAELFEEKQEKVPDNVGKTRPGKDDTVDQDAPSGPIQAPSSGAYNGSGAAQGGDDFVIHLPEDA